MNSTSRPPLTMGQVKKDFGWLGRITKIHTIGRYDVVEYERKPASNDEDRAHYINFGTYIDGKQTNYSYSTLDAALVGCVALAHDGINTRADGYFMRSIGADLPAVEVSP